MASDCVDHGVGMVCALVLGSDKVPSGSHKMGTETVQKAGSLGNGTGVGCNVMRPLIGKRPFLAVQP